MPTPQFITGNAEKKLAVVLPIKEYNKLIEELEDLEDVREFDKAMSKKQEFIPLEQVIEEIEKSKRRNSKRDLVNCFVFYNDRNKIGIKDKITLQV